MRRRPATLSFRGFIVLADIIFALAAGFMLLHPLAPSRPRPVPVPVPETPPCGDCEMLEQKLRSLMAAVQSRAMDIDVLAGKVK